MSEKGVYAVDRGIWTDPDFKNEPFTEREAFLWLVGEAAWRPTRTRVGSYTFELERGQCVFSTRFMAKRFQWSEARVRRFLERRSDLNQICTKTDAGATQITICKYDVFQRVGLPSDAGATQHRRRSDAKKKHLNIETLKEEADASSPTRVSKNDPTGPKTSVRGSRIGEWRPDIDVATRLGMTDGQAALERDKFVDFWLGKAGKDGVKADWPATWRNWCRNAMTSYGLSFGGARAPPVRPPSASQRIRDEILRHHGGGRQQQSDHDGPKIDGHAERR